MSKYRKVLEIRRNVTSTNRGFRTIQRSVAMYEQTKDSLTFIQKEYEDGRGWNSHETLTLVSFDNSFDCLSIFIHFN